MQKTKKLTNKKGISVLISYVLLISLALAMAAAAYIFLKPFAEKPLPEEACPAGVNIVLEDYNCYDDDGQKKIDITLKNRGLFNVTGVTIRMINETGEYPFLEGGKINPSLSGEDVLPVGTTKEAYLIYASAISHIKIMPFRKDSKGYQSYCTDAIVIIPVEGC